MRSGGSFIEPDVLVFGAVASHRDLPADAPRWAVVRVGDEWWQRGYTWAKRGADWDPVADAARRAKERRERTKQAPRRSGVAPDLDVLKGRKRRVR